MTESTTEIPVFTAGRRAGKPKYETPEPLDGRVSGGGQFNPPKHQCPTCNGDGEIGDGTSSPWLCWNCEGRGGHDEVCGQCGNTRSYPRATGDQPCNHCTKYGNRAATPDPTYRGAADEKVLINRKDIETAIDPHVPLTVAEDAWARIREALAATPPVDEAPVGEAVTDALERLGGLRHDESGVLINSYVSLMDFADQLPVGEEDGNDDE